MSITIEIGIDGDWEKYELTDEVAEEFESGKLLVIETMHPNTGHTVFRAKTKKYKGLNDKH